MSDVIVTQGFDNPELHTFEGYKRSGGYTAIRKIVDEMTPAQVIDHVKGANLRGRGGAGFSAGLKWSFVPDPEKVKKPRYLCVNADEGEPGTFKDKLLMERCPHRLVEGILIAAWAVRIKHAYIYIRGEFVHQARAVQKAVDEAYANNLLGEKILGKDFNLDITVHLGAGAYICGEETGLISSLEGYKGFPKLKPPFPAVEGAFGCPTVVNNVETLCFLPWIILEGNQNFLKVGSEKNPGTRMFCISGQVKKPGVYELPMGTTIKDLVYVHGGGMLDGRKLKAVIPGGASASWLTPDEIETKADFDALRTVGSMAGSGGVIVMDDTTCAVKAITRIAKFFAHESCGQCTPCREGTDWAYKILKSVLAGRATWKDIDLLVNVCTNMAGKTICVLSDAAADPIKSVVKKFRADFVPYIEGGRRSHESHPWVTDDPTPAMSHEANAAQHAPTHASPMGGK